MNLYWITFTIGLLGSFHCIGMCGPIAFALPLERTSKWSIYKGGFLYNLGRIFTYSMLGLVIGSIGLSFSMFGMQQTLSIVIGSLMIFSLFALKVKINIGKWSIWIANLKSALSQRFKKTGNVNLFGIGTLNGLLPCGLVYMALASATISQTPLEGMKVMAFFGLGTIPLMWSVAVLGASITNAWRKNIRTITPYFIFAIGVLFIIRGMDLGIPYLSPEFSPNGQESLNCHLP